jgi:hypothetical protein
MLPPNDVGVDDFAHGLGSEANLYRIISLAANRLRQVMLPRTTEDG